MALDLDINIIPAKEIDQKLKSIFGIQIALRTEQGNQTARESFQLSPLNKTTSFLTPQMRLCEEFAQIVITNPVLDEDGQNTSVLHAQFGANDRPDLVLT